MRDVSDAIEDVEITNYDKRSNSFGVKHSKEGQNDHLKSSDLETTLSAAGFGRFNWLVLLIAVPASVTSTMCSGATSLVLPDIGCEFKSSNTEKGILQVAPYFGMIISGFFWGSASDSFGRRKLFAYGFILDGVVSILASLSSTLWSMIILKTIHGMVSCGPFSIYMAYLSESFNLKYRDYAVLSSGVFSAMGNLMQPALAVLITVYIPFEPVTLFEGYIFTSWRLFLVLNAVPPLLAGFSSMLLPESPKFLFQSGNHRGALEVCKEIYSRNTGLPGSTFPVYEIVDPNLQTTYNGNGGVQDKHFFKRVVTGLALSLNLFKRPYVGRALMLCSIIFGSLASMNLLRLWLPQILAMVDNMNSDNVTSSERLCSILEKSTRSTKSSDCEIRSSTSYVDMMYVNALLLVLQVLFVMSVKHLGKKVPVVITALVPAISAAGMIYIDVKYIVYLAAVYHSTLNVAFFAISYLVTETFPTSLRATSLNTTLLSGRLGVVVSVSILSSFMFTHCHIIIPGISAALFLISLIAMLLPMTPFKAV